ncbi:hypothetical protein N7466_008533 [Penicillium verhagenii]|uniref:uncharacterized protein n=1 Tax=Penicillium verhagenii TaxID=1562060 RepID=UPI0025459CB6|nr:uncharacterized protein N7466_008533 [Penicillium verhagenii]KAJ5924346.1 hypothetical protein N7466_008533 [Penicillium verhagenii]
MEPQKLPEAAEEIRQEMKALIPQVWMVNEDIHGNKNYSGDAIRNLMYRMKVALKLDEVGITELARMLDIPVKAYKFDQFWKTSIHYTDIRQRSDVPRRVIKRWMFYPNEERAASGSRSDSFDSYKLNLVSSAGMA